jgi:Asp-tRNA(Asn)/Glu-tRNA(Gln) amidotransferase B subunit
MAQDRYWPTIGLEIHAELNTRTKMFCASKNDAAKKRPNINVCPVCMAHPGTLPVINRAAVEHVLRVGAALGAKLADYTEFDRKNYFYPDLPKGYQLSQFEYPLVSGGSLNGVTLTRIHLEEDTASSIHDESSGATLVDYNRAGVPLMELVTEPVLHSAREAGNFGRELQVLLRTLGASEADMEKGQMRLEANISVAKISPEDAQRMKNNSFSPESSLVSSATRSPSAHIFEAVSASASLVSNGSDSVGTNGENGENGSKRIKTGNGASERAAAEDSSGTSKSTGVNAENAGDLPEANFKVDISKLGTKVEVKNINSFRALERAIDYEVKRQIALLEKGEKVVQETRGWDEHKQATFSQRVKEGSADYRYFPDPDLPSLKLSELGLTLDTVKKTLPELPWEKRTRFATLGINTQDIELYVKEPLYGEFFEAVGHALQEKPAELKLASNYISNDLVKLITDIRDAGTRDMKILDIVPISPDNFAKVIRMASEKRISSRAVKELLQICMDGKSDPEVLAREQKLLQSDSSAQLAQIVAKIIADNATVVDDVKSGKTAAIEYLVGQAMKSLRGAADPAALRAMIKQQIGSSSEV